MENQVSNSEVLNKRWYVVHAYSGFEKSVAQALRDRIARTGMEDNIYLGKGELAKNNGEMVAKVVRILHELSLEPATPDEARQMLALKGPENVGF